MELEPTTKQPRKMGRRSTAQIESLLSEYENGKLSANAFCKLHQIKKVYLTRWIKRYRKNKPPKGFVAVCTSPESIDRQEVVIAEYRGIRFYQAVDPAFLKALVS